MIYDARRYINDTRYHHKFKPVERRRANHEKTRRISGNHPYYNLSVTLDLLCLLDILVPAGVAPEIAEIIVLIMIY